MELRPWHRGYRARKKMLKPGEYHLWYSKKHAKVRNEIRGMFRDIYYTLRNGEKVLITEANQSEKPDTGFDDLQYLGIGTFSNFG